MKKMLSVLTALALGSTTAVSVVACGPNETTLIPMTGEDFTQVLTNLGQESKLVFNLKVGTEKDSKDFWAQITDQFEDYFKKAGFEIKDKYNLGFTEMLNQDQLNEVGYQWNSGKLVDKETGERDFSESAIKIEMMDEEGNVTKAEAANLHWIINIVE